MGRNVVEKLLHTHLISGEPRPGCEVAIRIDQCLTQDATGTMAYLQFESMGLDRIRAELAVSYVDHNTIQVGFENADDHEYLRTAARRFGAIFSKPGNGICHQLHLERFGLPGKTLLGSDSHTPTGGGLGMLAMGAGGLDVAVAMGGGPFYLSWPRVRLVRLAGALPPGVSAKDVILAVLARYGTKGNVGWALEYGGPGVAGLDVPARATITNMGTELGVTTSVFPSDRVTRGFLKAQGREAGWRPLKADPSAAYDDVFDLDLASVEPMAACPHSPGNVATIASLAGRKVNQVLIGSCTNASYRDLKTVALLLRGHHVHPEVSAGVAPGSRQVVQMLAREGLLEPYISAGFRILENACGFCIGNSASPGSGGVSLRTSNRNFEGRSGTADAQVYLVSPETAVAGALNGAITDPRTLEPCQEVRRPRQFLADDSLFLYRDTAGVGVPDAEIRRGPNIGQPPAGQPLPVVLDGVATIKVGDRITTDHIMPAGARLKYRSNIPQYARYVFEGVDPGFHARAVAHRDAGRQNVIVAGESYGQGSSREHAAMCPMFLGVRLVVAKGFERIHEANLINFGILPCRFAAASDYDRLQPGDRLACDHLHALLEGGGELVNTTQGYRFAVTTALTDRQRRILLDGGLLRHVAAASVSREGA
jgi:aconitate hydratase